MYIGMELLKTTLQLFRSQWDGIIDQVSAHILLKRKVIYSEVLVYVSAKGEQNMSIIRPPEGQA